MNKDSVSHFKIINVYDMYTLKSIRVFTCRQCINRPYCRRHMDGIERCPVENELNTQKDLAIFNRALTYFGNQYPLKNNKYFRSVVYDIMDRYTR